MNSHKTLAAPAGAALPECLAYGENGLTLDGVSLKVIAQEFGTPVYVYSAKTLLDRFHAYQNALIGKKGLICYAVKANAGIALLKRLAQAGSGFDIVSAGELACALKAGADPKKIVYSGVGKRKDEIEAALAAGIKSFNIESAQELDRIAEIARALGKKAPISVRINPNVDAKTHPKISTGLKENKFGVALPDCLALYRKAASDPHLEPVGIDCHIGSQITRIGPFMEAARSVIEFALTLKKEGIKVSHLDFGGGLGVRYTEEDAVLSPETLITGTRNLSEAAELGDLELIFEPGRSVVADSGILLTKAEYIKTAPDRNFLIVDASMTEMVRVAMYGADMPLVPVSEEKGRARLPYDVVGPVCESSDTFRKGEVLPEAAQGDLYVILRAGAYGFSMASSYNMRALPPEVLVEDGKAFLIRQKAPLEDLWRNQIF